MSIGRVDIKKPTFPQTSDDPDKRRVMRRRHGVMDGVSSGFKSCRVM